MIIYILLFDERAVSNNQKNLINKIIYSSASFYTSNDINLTEGLRIWQDYQQV